MVVTEITDAADFDNKVKNAEQGKLVVVDFYAVWCGPCKMISPKLEAMSGEFTSAAFYKVDVDNMGEVAEDAGVSAMPTFLFYKGGNKIDELVGANEAKLRAAIQRHV